ncbi:thiamine pyrophosphate-binding protein [Janthinobacterium sp. LB2P49]|uniref:thiamine pyrophosphate-binding protein n=1 Tax=Janthinobacterium sp. LB2P49 TaxID=3424198 RepID=UPI003F241121
MKNKVSDLIAETLENLGITHAFGIIGAGNVHLFEAITRRGFTEIVCVHHEQAASMAMQTYYRSCGKLAACLLTTGAGSTNGVTGVVSAWADSIPGLVIAGNEHSKHTFPENSHRMWGVQGYDTVDMIKKVVKYAKRVMRPQDAGSEIEKAAFIALDQRPGPCWIEIPMDIQSAMIERDEMLAFVPPAPAVVDMTLLGDQLDSVIAALRKAERPVLWLGNGIRLAGAEKKLPILLDLLGVPSLVSWAGIDMIGSNHSLVYGRAGVYGQRSANFILQNSDYVLAIGTRLAIPQVGYDLSELARAARIDVVDIDEKEAIKLKPRIEQAIVFDAGNFIDALIEKVQKDHVGKKTKWITQCDTYFEQFPLIGPEHADSENFINSYRFIDRLNTFLKPDQVIVTDMGTALLCGHQVLDLRDGQRLMTSTGLGEMGYGLPAAIGASFAGQRSEVMCLNCDGGIMMNLQELQTIAHHQLPIKIFIFNNDGYLMIKHTQNSLFKNGYVGTDRKSGVSCPDFSKVAAAFDMPAYQIRDWENCDEVLRQVQAANGPVICEVFMHPEQLFVPKLSLVVKPDGSLVSPPLEDLSPVLPRHVLAEAMIIGMHEKSRNM